MHGLARRLDDWNPENNGCDNGAAIPPAATEARLFRQQKTRALLHGSTGSVILNFLKHEGFAGYQMKINRLGTDLEEAFRNDKNITRTHRHVRRNITLFNEVI
jgi:hypothetical protein